MPNTISETNAVNTARRVVKKDFMYTGVLLLGTNLGDKTWNIEQAIASIGGFSTVLARSSAYQSEAWGYDSTESYLNVALKIQFSLEPHTAMQLCLDIESSLGRTRSAAGYSDRIIDIDFLCIDNFSSNTEHLHVPHPRLHQRLFALLPLQEVHPYYIDTATGASITELISTCPDTSPPTRILYS